nr:immunoglobulin heavy chain junction region [Macaca mulatta]
CARGPGTVTSEDPSRGLDSW